MSKVEEYAFNSDPLSVNPTPVVSASLVETNGDQFLAMMFPLVTGAGLKAIVVRDNAPVGAAPQSFLRLRVTQP